MLPVPRRESFTCYVVFHGAEHQIWWRLFTPAGLRHVLLILPADGDRSLFDKTGQSIVVNGMSYTTNINLHNVRAADLARQCVERGATDVLRFKVSKRFTREFVPRGILTCVSLLKSVMGISAWWVITPAQLRKWMLENGAERI